MGIVFEEPIHDWLTLLSIITSLLYYYVHRQFTYWQRRGIATIDPSFPFGDFGPMFRQIKSLGTLTREWYSQCTAPLLGVYAVFQPVLLVRDPELIHTICIKDFQYFHDRTTNLEGKHDPLILHLVSLHGEDWKTMRKKLTPTFTTGKLKTMLPAILSGGNGLTKALAKASDEDNNDITDMRELCARYTTNVIASVAFGIEIDCFVNPDVDFRHYGRKHLKTTFKNGIRRLMEIVFPKILKYIKMKTIDQDVEDFMIGLVKRTMEYRENNNVTRQDFFQLLLQLRNTGTVAKDGQWESTIGNGHDGRKFLTTTEVAAQCFIFWIGGFETGSTTMAFCLYELAKNPDCQETVQREIDSVLQKYNGQMTYEAVGEMKYLECCIDEALRKHTSVPFTRRECTKDWMVPGTGITIQQGTITLIPTYAIHNDPKYFPQPEEFRPDRFSATNCSGKSFVDMPYMPFGEGPRSCIALRFGKLVTKIGLALMLVQNSYELAGNSLKPFKMDPGTIFLAPIGGIELKITKRKF